MTTTSHTPGPWYVHEHFTGIVEIRDAKENGNIADMRRNGRNMNMANANLLAAAPELLEALAMATSVFGEFVEHFLRIMPDDNKTAIYEGQVVEAIERARAVIARATGN